MTALLLLKKSADRPGLELADCTGTFTTMIISYLLTLIFDARGNISSQNNPRPVILSL